MRYLALAFVVFLIPACGGGGGGGGGGTTPAAPPGPGSLIATFGDIGFVANNPTSSTDDHNAIARDGSFLYVVGSRNTNGAFDVAWNFEKRSLVDGSLDTGFMTNGVGFSNPSAVNDTALGIAIDGSSMYVVGFDQQNGGLNAQWRIEKRNLSDGLLVAAFGAAGVIVNNPSAGGDGASCIATDGSNLYIAGFDATPGNQEWRIEKRRPSDGALVPAFGVAGVVTSNPSASDETPSCIAIDGNFLYVGGYDISGGSSEFRIEKRNLSDGALVLAFNATGVVTTNPSVGPDFVQAIAVDATALYVAGVDTVPGTQEWRVEKRSIVTGALDATFGVGGIATSNPSVGGDWTSGITLDGSNLYVAGYDSTFGNAQWRIEKRAQATGALVGSFGTAGVVTSNPNASIDDIPHAIVNDGAFLFIAGGDSRHGNLEGRIEKYDMSDGSPDASFGTPGVIMDDPSQSIDDPDAMAIDANYMYIGGYDSIAGNLGWRIEKRHLDTGALVPNFGTGGFVTSNPTAQSDDIRSIVVTPSAIFIGGYDNGPGNTQWRLEKRDIVTGALVGAFGAGGVVTVNPSANAESILAMAADATGIYVVGSDFALGATNGQWRIEKRQLDTGALIAAFGAAGVALSNPSANNDYANAIVIDSTSMYVGGWDAVTSNADTAWHIEKRDLTTGTLVAAFGTAGAVRNNVGLNDEGIYSMVIVGATLYCVGYDTNPGTNEWHVEARDITTGALVPSFGTAGTITTDVTVQYDYAQSVTTDGTSLYIGGTQNGGAEFRVEKRDVATGALVPSFGTGGVVSSGNASLAVGLAVDSTGLYLAEQRFTGTVFGRIEKRLK